MFLGEPCYFQPPAWLPGRTWVLHSPSIRRWEESPNRAFAAIARKTPRVGREKRNAE